MLQRIGKMIFTLREETGVAQKDLASGLLSVAELSRIESGGQERDSFLLEALFQRLGKSVDKIEMMVSEEEYQLFVLRGLILENLRNKDCELAALLLEEYGEHPDCGRPLHMQYLLQMKALNEYLVLGDMAQCAGKLARALEITFPDWKKEWESACLCIQEIQILLLLFFFLYGLGKTCEAEQGLKQLLAHLERRVTDGEEKAKVYPQCAWLLGQIYMEDEKPAEAVKVCRAGIQCLCENGVITLLDRLLGMEETCLRKLGRQAEAQECIKQKEAVEFLYEISECEIPQGDALGLLMTSVQREFLVSNEFLREVRLSQNMSQMTLSEGICSWETLSRIESGKRSPHRKNLYQMLQKLQLERESYYGYIVADDYALYEKVRESRRKWAKGELEEAAAIVEEIAQQLDMSITQNRQYIETMRLVAKIRKKEIGDKQAIEELEKVLRYTMKDYTGNVYRTPFRGESDILNQIAISLRHLGREEEAISLYEQILDKYRQGKVSEMHHVVPEMDMYINCGAILEDKDELEKAEMIDSEGIRLFLRCQRGDVAAEILANYACVFEKKNNKVADILGEKCLRCSWNLLKMYGYDEDSKVVETYYKCKYGKEICE